MTIAWLIIWALFLPLMGGLITLATGQTKFSLAGMVLAFGCSLPSLFAADTMLIFDWLPGMELMIRVDLMAAILISLVLLVSLLVHVFSVGYMANDAGKARYFAKLGFFTFSMVGLLLADHLILLFVFWELVGLASYLLIGFWYEKDGVPSAARLAFMVNRIADVGLLAGILMVWQSGTLQLSAMDNQMTVAASLLIAIGAFGKSAQLPFSGWLTKAMVGPTPVSALIHAATMVAAGVYLLIRVSPTLHPTALTVVAIVGALTALYGALCALFQHDLKKILAYSTISQLGYMVLGIGVGGAAASFFHLTTHAFFKAGLFLGAGAIIHYMHKAGTNDAQDIRQMGGLRKTLPWTYRTFLMGALALAGIPFFSGFMSKDAIIISAWDWANLQGTWGYLVPDLALITVFLTALYVGRLVLIVFWGDASATNEKTHEHVVMKWPLVVLAVGSLWIGFNWNPFAHHFWVMGMAGESSLTTGMVTFLSILLAGAGTFLAYSFFKPGTSYVLRYRQGEVRRLSLLFNGLYLTQGYQKVGHAVARAASLTFAIDQRVVDGLLHWIGIGTVVFSKVLALIDRFVVDGPVNAIGSVSSFFGKWLARLSARDLQTQLAWLLFGAILILSWLLFF